MLTGLLITINAAVIVINSQHVVIVEGDQPRRSSRLFIGQRRHDDLKAYAHDSAQDVIYAPLNGKRVITKGLYYMNGKSKKDDHAFESMLLGGAESIEGIDPFYVTRPPPRTTVAVKNNPDDTPPENAEDVNKEVTMTPKITTRHALRLVTIAPQPTTPLPPFKHVSRRPAPTNDVSNSTRITVVDSSSVPQGVRFPAESWQLPPSPPMPGFPGSIPYPLLSPPNPFLPIMPVKELNITYPFIPIPKQNSGLPLSSYSAPPSSIYPPPNGNNDMIHKSSLRQGSYVRNREVPTIPLYSAQGSTAPIGGDYAKQKVPEASFAIDGGSMGKVQETAVIAVPYLASRRVQARSINGPYRDNREEQNSSEQLRLFARNHPNMLKSMTRPMFFKENQIILPKSNTADRQMPTLSRARTALTPNEKLDLCCKKRRVNSACQALCNFEALNDKTEHCQRVSDSSCKCKCVGESAANCSDNNMCTVKLVAAFLTNVCPGPQQADAFECASSKVDHSACCERAGLLNFHGGKCLQFCRAHENRPINPLEFIPCLQVFDHIKSCFREYQTTHPNILGD